MNVKQDDRQGNRDAHHWEGLAPHTVFAVFPDRQKAEVAGGRLSRSGIAADNIYVLSGAKGAAELDPAGEHHGFWGKVSHALQQFTDATQCLESYARQIQEGKAVVAVRYEGRDERQTATSLLIDSGGTDINYTSNWTVTGVVEPKRTS